MLSKNEAMVVCFTARNHIYKLLSRLFGDEPSLEILNMLVSEHTEYVLGLMLNTDQAADTVLALSELKETLTNPTKDLLELLKDEYTRLLLGPGKLIAPPWESVYKGKEDMIFNECILDVRRSYRRHILQSENYPHDADDHIALELDFMAVLSSLLRDCYQQQCYNESEQLILSQKTFLEDHLLQWVPIFATRLQSVGENLLYSKLAMLTHWILCSDKEILDELMVFNKPCYVLSSY